MRKTNEQFLEELLDKNTYYRNGDFYVYSDYKNNHTHIMIITEYGVCKSTPKELLKGCNPCNIYSAYNKTQYFKEQLERLNIDYAVGVFTIDEDYRTSKHRVLTKDKYGYCRVSPHILLSGGVPSLTSAINKKEYVLNRLKDTHPHFDNLDFSKTVINKRLSKTIVTCKKHGDFVININNFITTNQNCAVCRDETLKYSKNGGWSITNWEDNSKTSKYFDSFKVYIVKCWDENEEFYKIGRTFTTVKKRYKGHIPYNYEEVKIYEFEDAKEAFDLEVVLKRENKNNRYDPLKNFHGKRECFTQVNY